MKNVIVIQDWAGNVLFEGNYQDKEVDQVLDANRCSKCDDFEGQHCDECDDTGYSGDFEVYWKDSKDKRNVYEYINY